VPCYIDQTSSVNMSKNDSESNLSMGEETDKDNVSVITNMDMVRLFFLVF
jgi:hypothetical protein